MERAATPFERLEAEFEQGQTTDAVSMAGYMDYWARTLASDGKRDKLDRFIKFSHLEEAELAQMFAPAKLSSEAELPSWAFILSEIIQMDAGAIPIHSPLDAEKIIPFEDILIPFVKVFRNQLQAAVGKAYNRLTTEAHREVEQFVMAHLSTTMHEVLMTTFQAYLANHLGPQGLAVKSEMLPEDHYYRQFVRDIQSDHLRKFFQEYPILARIASNMLSQYIGAFTKFLHRLDRDQAAIIQHFGLQDEPGAVTHLNLGISDPHKGGEGVMILLFENGWKLVYKPRCMKIGLAYNQLCQWVNERLSPPIKVLNILAGEGYGWIEFAPHSSCEEKDMIERYYERAGILLGITYMLNSTDFHSENLIASGEHPVLVDHETLIQAALNIKMDSISEADRIKYEKNQQSVLQSAMLPMHYKSTNVPNDSISGFGSIQDGTIKIKSVKYLDPNTDHMRMEAFEYDHETRSNLPMLSGVIQRIPAYEQALKTGFRKIYDLIIANRKELLSANSPLNAFQHLTLRTLFRSTTIYAVILKNLLKPQYLKDATRYGLRLELFARAFVTRETPPAFWQILKAERLSALNRDIPCFELSSDGEDLILSETEVLKSYFSTDSLTCIRNKIRQMGKEDFDFQLDLISRSIKGDFNS